MAAQSKRRRGKRALVVLLMTAAVVAILFWQHVRNFADRPLQLSAQERVLVVEPGDGFDEVLRKLRALGVEQGSDLDWKTLAVGMQVAAHLQVGEYAVASRLTPRVLLRHLKTGKVIQRRFAIIEGWSFRELRAALARDRHLAHDIDRLSDAEVMTKLGRAGVSPEGRFLPETYHYTHGMSDLRLLERAAKAMDQELAAVWATRAKDLPLTSPEQLLTLASIVEKETGQASERERIAGVFVRRLQIGMRLQTDPTVIYGLGAAYDGNIRRQDLLTDTPFNTYTRSGLPPTPIAMPGRLALRAAAQPEPGSALYFVARGDGAHYFSATLGEHEAAVREFQLKR